MLALTFGLGIWALGTSILAGVWRPKKPKEQPKLAAPNSAGTAPVDLASFAVLEEEAFEAWFSQLKTRCEAKDISVWAGEFWYFFEELYKKKWRPTMSQAGRVWNLFCKYWKEKVHQDEMRKSLKINDLQQIEAQAWVDACILETYPKPERKALPTSVSKITTNPERIDRAHYLLQRLEDEIVGYTGPVFGDEDEINATFKARLDRLHVGVWEVIRELNEAYDETEGKGPFGATFLAKKKK